MNKRTIGTIAVAAALVAVLAVPVLAQAGRSTAAARDKTTISAAKTQAKADAKAKTAAKKARLAAEKAARQAKRAAAAAARAKAKASKTKGQPDAQLQKRISNKLAARKHRFDAVTANLSKRVARLAALSTRVAAAGGDVSAVNAKLDTARQHLANAIALEQTTIAKFQAVSTAGDRKAGFVEARDAGRAAVAELKVTRAAIRDAASTLRTVVDGLRSESATETIDAQ